MIGLAIVVVLVFTAVFADYIAPFGYADQDLMAAFEEPSKAHLFGTDEFGRDIFSRIIYGSRISLQVASSRWESLFLPAASSAPSPGITAGRPTT
jgi:peptide/nickel transport system permease protein